MTTTNFNDWLDCLEEKDTETMANLYQSVNEVTQMGDFTTTTRNNRLFVKAKDNEDTLMISSDFAKKTFLSILDRNFGGEFGRVLAAAEFRRAMEKND